MLRYDFLPLRRGKPLLSPLLLLFFLLNSTITIAWATTLEDSTTEGRYQQNSSNTHQNKHGYDFQILDSRFLWLDSNEILYKKDFLFDSKTLPLNSRLPLSSTFMPGESKIKFLLNTEITFPPSSPFKSHSASNLLFDQQLSIWELNSTLFMDNKEAAPFSPLIYDKGEGFNTILPTLTTPVGESDYTQPPLMERMKSIAYLIVPLIIIIAFLSHNLRLPTALSLLIIWFVGFELFKLLRFIVQLLGN